MTRRDLASLAELLARAALVPGLDDAARADYEAAREVVTGLAARFDTLSDGERERVELNADLPQLAFHLAEELRAGTPDTTPAALQFMRRHIPRLLAEFRDGAREQLDPLDAELLLGLARLARRTFDARFAEHYARAGYRRPFVDKLYRDYALTGVPGGLLGKLDDLANAGEHDIVLCVLKGALPYVLLMELLGLPPEKIRCVAAGRSTGSHIAPDYAVTAIGFDLNELKGRRVLIVDNNAATGETLAHLARAVPPAHTTLFLDYVLQPMPALARTFDEVVCGPFAEAEARDLKRAVAARLSFVPGR